MPRKAKVKWKRRELKKLVDLLDDTGIIKVSSPVIEVFLTYFYGDRVNGLTFARSKVVLDTSLAGNRVISTKGKFIITWDSVV